MLKFKEHFPTNKVSRQLAQTYINYLYEIGLHIENESFKIEGLLEEYPRSEGYPDYSDELLQDIQGQRFYCYKLQRDYFD